MNARVHCPRVAVLATTLMLGVLAPGALGQENQSPNIILGELHPPPVLTVTGHGEVNARPDKASVQLGAESQAETAAAAQQAVNTILQKSIKQIKQLGIPEQAIQTARLSLSPIYSTPKPGRESEAPKLVAYRASNTIRVEVTDLALLGQVIDAGIRGGANRLAGVSFELQNELPSRLRALQEAADEAHKKAQALAQVLGVKLTAVRRASEGSFRITRPPLAFGEAARAAATPTPVAPGELKIEASVTVEYSIESK